MTLKLPCRTPSRDPRLRVADCEECSSPYSQHSKLLEPSKVILVDPSDIVAVELPERKGERKC